MKIYAHFTPADPLHDAIRKALPEMEFVDTVEEAEIVIGNPKPNVLAANKNLRFVQLRSAGANNYVSLFETNPGIQVCCATGAYGHAVAEHMYSALLCLMKRLNDYAVQQTTNVWKDLGKARTICGANVLVLGLGDIGSAFARMARGMGANVIGVRRHPAPAPEVADEVYGIDALDELLPKADVIAMIMPDTPETVKMMNMERFKLVKPGAFLVNAGRGSAIDESALIWALENGILAGASIDVASVEPLPSDSPLWNTKNLLITPHVAGGNHLDDIGEGIVKIAAQNVRAFLNGQPLKSVVDEKTGYRKL